MRYLKMGSALLIAAFCAQAQSLIVTAEGRHGSPPPDLMRDDVSVELDKRPAQVQSLVPLRGNEANLELYIVIDDGDDTDLGLQFRSLKEFVKDQSPATQIGLAYLQNGSAKIVAPLSTDHEKVAGAFRLPFGQPGISASPYIAISDLMKKWPATTTARREILLISSGIDPYWSQPDPDDPYLQKAIADAQRDGIVVHSIYYPGAGHFGHSYWRTNWGQNFLAELGDGTGGEAYWQGGMSPVSFDPYLKDLSERLQNQYRLTLTVASGGSKLKTIHVTSAKAGVSLMSASRIRM